VEEKETLDDQPLIIDDDDLDNDDDEGGFSTLWKFIIPILLLVVIFGVIGYYYYISQQDSDKVVPNVPDKTMEGIKKFTATASKDTKKSGFYKQPQFGASALDSKPYPSTKSTIKVKNLEKQRKSTMSKLSTFDEEFDKKKEKSAIEGPDKNGGLKKLPPKLEIKDLKSGPKIKTPPTQQAKPQQKPGKPQIDQNIKAPPKPQVVNLDKQKTDQMNKVDSAFSKLDDLAKSLGPIAAEGKAPAVAADKPKVEAKKPKPAPKKPQTKTKVKPAAKKAKKPAKKKAAPKKKAPAKKKPTKAEKKEAKIENSLDALRNMAGKK